MNEAPLSIALSALSFMLAIIWGGPLIRLLRHFKIGKLIRVEEPGIHKVKMGTPTMGGVMIIVPVVLLTVLLNAASIIGLNVFGRSVILPMLVMVAYGALGAHGRLGGCPGFPPRIGYAGSHKIPHPGYPGFDRRLCIAILHARSSDVLAGRGRSF